MRIEKHSHDKNYPYTLVGDWGQEMSCSREDLIALKSEIERILDHPRQPQPRADVCDNMGKQIVRKMIEAYEGKRRTRK